MMYLALGDSYTIGEQVAITESFPYQLVQMLRKAGKPCNAAEIIAKTGFTTSDLQKCINETFMQPPYNLVTLLIGVNNQYRNLPLHNYENEFEKLLQQAIKFADNKEKNVVVLSIPDWGATNFAEGENREPIAEKIDTFNNVNKNIAVKYNVQYVDITPGTRNAFKDISLLAADGLHYSGKEYARWAKLVADYFLSSQ
jgi:lysophospholipase L1-like esterase